MSSKIKNIRAISAQPFQIALIEDLVLYYSQSIDELWGAINIDGSAELTLGDLERSIEWLIEATQMPELTLKISERVGFNQLGAFGPLIASCPTIRDAANLYRRFKNLLHPLFELQVVESEEHFEVLYTVEPDEKYHRYYAETALGALPIWFKRLSGVDLAPLKVKFRHPEPAYASAYVEHFQAPVEFGQNVNSMLCRKEKLDLPCSSHSPRVYSAMMEKASEQIVAKKQLTELITDKFRAALPEQLSFAQMAVLMHLSERTLQRRLMEEGTHYKELKQDLLKAEAILLLESTNLTIEQVAYRLGYEQRSSFSAAFQRWTGTSPGHWRRQ